ncbi:chemotaxis protein CheW [Candidatus Uabimicrobium amorphum]|uniref:Chemotaxis protein CheW n=1 Tax=Uabimicrobium amorphum TaxID=2596890 RepID=A0A5S9IMB3_UABAM|nr:chemotaxis protein CheW [Candidatus Uabimicrobium amorphum]BBM83185.1 chemotaxis protein CheW [Candidatus Uabimicrobium amorphum]
MSSANVSNKYLTFGLDNQTYGIQIANVSEIIAIKDITPIPQTPNFVAGMVNVRGKVIPIINLRKKFDLTEKEYDRNTCIAIVYIKQSEMGIIVDAVYEVTEIQKEFKEETPQFGSAVKTEFIEAIAKDLQGIKILLNIEKVLTSEELVIVNDIVNAEKTES